MLRGSRLRNFRCYETTLRGSGTASRYCDAEVTRAEKQGKQPTRLGGYATTNSIGRRSNTRRTFSTTRRTSGRPLDMLKGRIPPQVSQTSQIETGSTVQAKRRQIYSCPPSSLHSQNRSRLEIDQRSTIGGETTQPGRY
jgi:hypothetical protein